MPDTIVAVKTILLHDGQILLLQRASNALIDAGEWEIIGGRLEFGESPTQCLVREVLEETGLEIRVQKLLYATSVMVSPEKQVIGLTYLSLAEGKTPKLSQEHQDYQWVDQGKLRELLNKRILADFVDNGIFDILP